MMVIFLTGLVSMILMRTLKKDYAKYAKEDDDLESLERDISEESGWKLVRWLMMTHIFHTSIHAPSLLFAALCAVAHTCMVARIHSIFISVHTPQVFPTITCPNRCTATCSVPPASWSSSLHWWVLASNWPP